MTETEQARLAADWATILRSEAAALAGDREVQEALERAALLMAQRTAAFQATDPQAGGGDAPGPAGADAAPRAAALDAAPGDAGENVTVGGAGRVAAARGSAAGLG